MARKPLELPKAIDKFDDAVKRFEKAFTGVQKALEEVDYSTKHTKPVDALPFASDIAAIVVRLAILKGKL